jgi:tripartite-type tricarboxylate transporter receptor subunit TctC
MHKTLPYDSEKDFTPVTNLVSNGGLFFAVANSCRRRRSRIHRLREAGPRAARLQPPGVGNTWHLRWRCSNHMTGLKMTHIPYKGGGRRRPRSLRARCR